VRFYLGTKALWLAKTDVPIFVSRSSLHSRVYRFHRALGPWALDSGGFTEIEKHGRWTVDPETYAREVRLWQREIGNLDWASPQDLMCEPHMLLRAILADGYADGVRERRKGEKDLAYRRYMIGKAQEWAADRRKAAMLRQRVCVHQQRTIDNLITLRELAPEVAWIPVLQGWFPQDYIAHANAYYRAGIDLAAERIVGLGSVCRRSKLDDAELVISILAGDMGLKLHGFGLKKTAFKNKTVVSLLASADSMAWSAGGRWGSKKEGGKLCKAGRHHGKCNNCLHWALEWRDATLGVIEETLFGENEDDCEDEVEEDDDLALAANPDEDDSLAP